MWPARRIPPFFFGGAPCVSLSFSSVVVGVLLDYTPSCFCWFFPSGFPTSVDCKQEFRTAGGLRLRFRPRQSSFLPPFGLSSRHRVKQRPQIPPSDLDFSSSFFLCFLPGCGQEDRLPSQLLLLPPLPLSSNKVPFTGGDSVYFDDSHFSILTNLSPICDSFSFLSPDN